MPHIYGDDGNSSFVHSYHSLLILLLIMLFIWLMWWRKNLFFCARIACLSCPSVFNKLRALNQLKCQIFCLEYDKRFATFGSDYVFYDYNDPLNLPAEFERNSFDVVIADPPFLSEECLRKTAMTVNFLAKDKVILCTGRLIGRMLYSYWLISYYLMFAHKSVTLLQSVH